MSSSETNQENKLRISIDTEGGDANVGNIKLGDNISAGDNSAFNTIEGDLNGNLVTGSNNTINIIQQAAANETTLSPAELQFADNAILQYREIITSYKSDPWAKYGNKLHNAFKPALEKLWDTDFHVVSSNASGTANNRQEVFMAFKSLKMTSQLATHGERLVILAGAGMGKTPSLYSLRHGCAHRRTSYIPIYLHLQTLASGQGIEAIIADHVNGVLAQSDNPPTQPLTFKHLEGLTRRGSKEWQLVFLMDDLDHLAASSNQYALQSLNLFMQNNPQHHFVFTCRDANYREPLGPLPLVTLDQLSKLEVDFIFAGTPPEVLTLTPSTRDLARNRALLKTILELGSKATKKGLNKVTRLTKGRLIQQYNTDLLEIAFPDDSAESAIRKDLQEGLLEFLAFVKLTEGLDSFKEAHLRDLIVQYLTDWRENWTWREALQGLLASGIITKNDNRTYQFDDSTAEAYFAASAILHDEHKKKELIEQIAHPRWLPTIEILVGLIQDPMPLMFNIVDRDVFVAAHCVSFTGGTADHALLEDAIIDSLLENLYLRNSADRCRIIQRIGSSTHTERAVEALKIALKREWSSQVVLETCRQLVKHLDTYNPFDPEKFKKLTSYTIDDRVGQITALLTSYNHESLTATELYNIIISRRKNYSPLVRGAAAICLGFQETEESKQILFDLFFRSTKRDDFIIWSITEALSLRVPTFTGGKELHLKAPDPSSKFEKDKLYTVFNRSKSDQQRCQIIYLISFMSYDEYTAHMIKLAVNDICLLYTSPSPRDGATSRMPSSA